MENHIDPAQELALLRAIQATRSHQGAAIVFGDIAGNLYRDSAKTQQVPPQEAQELAVFSPGGLFVIQVCETVGDVAAFDALNRKYDG